MGYSALSRKNITSKKTEMRLNDLFARLHYERQVPYEDNLEKEAAYGQRIWPQEQEVDPWEFLAWALIGQAALDYVICRKEEDPMASEIEKWFARNGYSWSFFEILKNKTDACRTLADFDRLERSIRLIH